jgi:hypothetical protein
MIKKRIDISYPELFCYKRRELFEIYSWNTGISTMIRWAIDQRAERVGRDRQPRTSLGGKVKGQLLGNSGYSRSRENPSGKTPQ